MKNIRANFFLLLLCTNISVSIYGQATNIQDSLALVDLYNSTNGANWRRNDNWLTGPVKKWYGVSVRNTRVINIYLGSNNLRGSIPPSLGGLSELDEFSLQNNQLNGSIPPEFGNLSSLGYLNLGRNQLTGSIPAQFGKLSKLGELDLRHNRLSGSIPSSLGGLSHFVFLYLQGNRLSGSIPAELGNLSILATLDLTNNQLSGGVPPELENLSRLLRLKLSHNQLSGIPSAKVGQSRPKINLKYNHFTFEGMEELLKKRSYNIKYSPQANIPVHVLNDGSLSVSAGGTLNNNTYKWFQVGQSGSTIIQGDSVFHPSQNGKYYAAVTNSICMGLALHTDTVDFNNAIPITKASLPTEQNRPKNIAVVYPNPAKNLLHIQTKGNASFYLVNQSGKILLNANINVSGTMNVSSIAAGLYYLKNNISGDIQKIMIVR